MYTGMYTQRPCIHEAWFGALEIETEVGGGWRQRWCRGALPPRSREIRVTPGVEIKGAVHAREMPRLRHVFLDNLFGNINHRERHEMLEGVRASVQRGSMHGERHASCSLSALSQEERAAHRHGRRIAD